MKQKKILVNIFVSIFVFTIISCSSTPKMLKITPKILDFGNVNLSESSTLILTMTNKYSKDVFITNINLSDLTNYSIVSGAALPINISKNGIHEISIKYEPTSGGIHAAQLFIEHDASTKPKVVEITGVGIPIPKILLSDQYIDFTAVLIGRDKTENITVENTGTAELILDSLQFSGAGASVFSISSGGPVPIIIQPGTMKDISVKFTPTVVQNYIAELHISHNGLNETTPITIALSGDGVITAPKISLDKSTPWDFGSIGVGLSSTQNLEITNTGTDPLTVDSATLSTNNEFKVAGVEDSNGNPITLPEIVAISAKIIVKIEFKPIAGAAYNDTISIIHDGVNTPSPATIDITGEGRIILKKTFSYTGSIESWTIPAGVTSITIEAWGAQGGINDSSQVGGWGTQMKGTFTVTPGDTMRILVGQQGAHGSTALWSRCGGGSGGSFVWKDGANMPMIVAGGGGGKGYLRCSNSMDASTSTSGVIGYHPGGTNGNGGTGGNVLSDDGAGGGGGWLSDGSGMYPGKKVYNGTGAGGVSTYNNGGFGGGGGSSNTAGGGGGYSGGGGGWYGFNTSIQYNGGGGGSYNSGSNPTNIIGTRQGNGYVEISY